VKACGKRIQDWPRLLPYYMAFGTEPVFPFDLEEATYLAPSWPGIVDTETENEGTSMAT